MSYPRSILPGTVSDDLVSVLDVFPTLVDFMDLPLPPGRSGQPLPAITSASARTAVFAETGIEGAAGTREDVMRRLEAKAAEGRPHRLPFQTIANSKLKMVRTHEWKYVHQAGGEHELYHLASDPYELHNLVDAPEHRERVYDFQRQLLDWAITTEDTLPQPDPAVQAADRGV